MPPSGTTVVLARVRDLTGEASANAVVATWADMLSPRERSRAAEIGHTGRRAEWLAGRLLAKFVCATRDRHTNRATDEKPEFQIVRGTDVWARGCTARFSQLEIWSRARGATGGRPRLHRVDAPAALDIHLSIAHGAGWVAVAASSTPWVGVDLEAVAEYSDTLCRNVLSEEERSWIARGPDHARRATLLWTLKEATYKSGACGDDWEPRNTMISWEDPDAEPPPTSAAIAERGLMSALALRLHHRGQRLPHRAAMVGCAAWIATLVEGSPAR